jgi:hypothetical protein
MLKTATLKMARRHLEHTIELTKQYSTMAADGLAAQIAIDCIDFCIAYNEAVKQSIRDDAEIEAVFNRRDNGCQELG